MTRRVLFVNQTDRMSGAERSLLDLIDALPDEIEPVVGTPAGELHDELLARGVQTKSIEGTDMSFRLHPVHTVRGLAWIAATGRRIHRLASAVEADVVHANSARAGLAASLAWRDGSRPTVVHLRDRMPQGRLPRLTLAVIARRADAIIANSAFVAGQLPASPRCPVRVVHNGVDGVRLDPDRIDRAAARERLGLEDDDEVLAVIGQFVHGKGQDHAVRVLAQLRPSRPRLRLLVAGSAKFTAPSTRFDNAAYELETRRLAASLGLGTNARFLGEITDVAGVLRAADILLVPSLKEGFGRVVLEGMAMRLPVLATDSGGPAEIVRDEVDGRLLPPRDVRLWASVATQLLDDSEMRARMGTAGRARALSEFGSSAHAARVLALYDWLLRQS